ncbi:7851_t:CDS:2 [Diversispora eburnea]|uniref:7851_t:CDS:1 n=1 Tax=Diversispora eburnea TaxID=1213867 RepID=A0A9N9A1U1_9GLOM|nr:7851_t:CDS:2 [Diversispora eburnea]
MSQGIEKIKYCPAGHSSEDISSSYYQNFNWENDLIGCKVTLKEIKDSRYDIVEFLKVVKTVNHLLEFIKYYGISKNPFTRNYIFVTESFDDDLHNFLAKTFWNLRWKQKINMLDSITWSLRCLHERDLVHCDLHSGNILNILKKPDVNLNSFDVLLRIDLCLGLCKLENICNGVRPKVPDFMLNLIPEWYLNLMYRCWSDDPSQRPTVTELANLFCVLSEKLDDNIVDNDVMRQLKISDENTSKSQKQELFELFSYSNKLHPQSCYISRYIHTLNGLYDRLDDLKSGKSADPNLLLKSNEPTIFDINNT